MSISVRFASVRSREIGGGLFSQSVDGRQALRDRREQILDLGLSQPSAGISCSFLNTGHLFVDRLRLRIVGAESFGQMLLLGDELPDVIRRSGERDPLGDRRIQAGRVAT